MMDSTKSPIPDAEISWPSRLETFRPYLLDIAVRKLPHLWQGKLAASDLVQQTLVEAVSARPSRSLHAHELQRWLFCILMNNLQDGRRRLLASKRAIGREIVSNKSRLLRGASSPSSDDPATAAIRSEEGERLDRAIARLSPTHQCVIRLRHAEDRRFSEIASILSLSENAAQKLWVRATEELRRIMKESA